MAVEPHSNESREGSKPPVARASAGVGFEGEPPRDAGGPERERRRHRTLLAYRCRACGKRFAVARAGVAPCPRCGSVEEHHPLGRIGGERDGR